MMEMTGIEEEEEKRVFMVSDFSGRQIMQMDEAIMKLGGRMSDKPTSFNPLVNRPASFDPLATHLVTSSVARTEKFLMSVASGLWVLHPSFVTESLSEGKWLEEENFDACSEGEPEGHCGDALG